MLKELWESFKRQWEEWKVLRWWTRRRAAHYVKEEDAELFKHVADIFGLDQLGMSGLVVHTGVEKIRLFGRTEACDYLVRTHGPSILVEVNLMPFFGELRLLDGTLWTDMATQDMTAVPYEMCNAEPIPPRTVNAVWLGTILILVVGKATETISINHCIQLMMKYFLNLSVNYAARVAEAPLTNPVYSHCSDVALLEDRIKTIQAEWDKAYPTMPPPEPAPVQQTQEQDDEEKKPEQTKEETNEQPEVN